MKIKFERWPWQTRRSMALLSDPTTEAVGMKYGWKPTPGMGRFGGGWRWKLGIMMGSKSCIIDLVFGSIRISWGAK